MFLLLLIISVISFVLNLLIIFLIRLISDSLSFCEVLSSFFSDITIVNSPFSSFLNVSNSSIFLLIYSSYNLEISLQNTIFLPAKYFLNPGIILLIFFYDEKKTSEYMKNENIEINIETFTGSENFTVYTMDFTKKYIEINADYRS